VAFQRERRTGHLDRAWPGTGPRASQQVADERKAAQGGGSVLRNGGSIQRTHVPGRSRPLCGVELAVRGPWSRCAQCGTLRLGLGLERRLCGVRQYLHTHSLQITNHIDVSGQQPPRYSEFVWALMRDSLTIVNMDLAWKSHLPKGGACSWDTCDLGGCNATNRPD